MEFLSSKDKKFKVGVINLMGNVFMRKTDDVFKTAHKISKKIVLKKMLIFQSSTFMVKLRVKKWL